MPMPSALPVLLLSLLILVPSAQGMQRGAVYDVRDAAEAQAMMETLQRTVFATDGSGERTVYILYSTGCGWSQRLFADTRGLGEGVQLRWIPVGTLAAGRVVSERDADAVGAAFAGGRGENGPDPAFSRRALTLNVGALRSLQAGLAALGHGSGRSFHFPTLVWATEEGLRVSSGAPGDLSVLLKSPVPGADNGNGEAGLEIAGRTFETKSSLRLERFDNRSDESASLKILPHDLAPVVHELEAGQSLPVTGVVGERWLELDLGNGRSVYMDDRNHAELALLDYSVKRKRGTLTAEGEPLRILSHPHAKAPELFTLDAGYQIESTGEVRVGDLRWVEVRAYRDGTPGYVAR